MNVRLMFFRLAMCPFIQLYLVPLLLLLDMRFARSLRVVTCGVCTWFDSSLFIHDARSSSSLFMQLSDRYFMLGGWWPIKESSTLFHGRCTVRYLSMRYLTSLWLVMLCSKTFSVDRWFEWIRGTVPVPQSHRVVTVTIHHIYYGVHLMCGSSSFADWISICNI